MHDVAQNRERTDSMNQRKGTTNGGAGPGPRTLSRTSTMSQRSLNRRCGATDYKNQPQVLHTSTGKCTDKTCF